MANTFINAKNQHLKNYVPVWTKKEMTDASPEDYIDISWVDAADNLEYDERKLVSTEALKKLHQKVDSNLTDFDNKVEESLDGLKEKAKEIIDQAIAHHKEDINRFLSTVSNIRQTITDVEQDSITRDNEEKAAREEAIQALQKELSEALAKEVADRIAADEALYEKLDRESSEKDNLVRQLVSSVSGSINKRIDTEVAEANSKISETNSKIDNEIEQRQIADDTLKSEINTQIDELKEQDTHLEWLMGEKEAKLDFRISAEKKLLTERLEGLFEGALSKIADEVAAREAAVEEIKVELGKKANDGTDNFIFQELCNVISFQIGEREKAINALRDELLEADAEISAQSDAGDDALWDYIFEAEKKAIVEKTLELTASNFNGGIAFATFPANAKIVKLTATIGNDEEAILYPTICPVGGSNDIVFEFYKKEDAPEDFAGYTNVTVTYTCTIADFEAWTPNA